MEANKVYCGDCIELMRQIPDGTVDMVFADPPFNLKKKYNRYDDQKKRDEYVAWCKTWLLEMVRVTKTTGSIFVHNIPKWLIYFGSILNDVAEFKHWISWDAPTAPMGSSLQPAHYGILYYTSSCGENKFYEIRYNHKRCRKCKYMIKDYGGKKNELHPFGPLVSDVWTDIHRVRHNKYRDNHPCQLPIHLLERLILMTTDEGDLVLDPFIGTGTTAIAAKRLGREYIGIDIDEKYVRIAENKLEQENEQTKLGNIWLSIFRGDIVTIRDKDWDELAEYYDIPEERKKIDSKKIIKEVKLTKLVKKHS